MNVGPLFTGSIHANLHASGSVTSVTDRFGSLRTPVARAFQCLFNSNSLPSISLRSPPFFSSVYPRLLCCATKTIDHGTGSSSLSLSLAVDGADNGAATKSAKKRAVSALPMLFSFIIYICAVKNGTFLFFLIVSFHRGPPVAIPALDLTGAPPASRIA